MSWPVFVAIEVLLSAAWCWLGYQMGWRRGVRHMEDQRDRASISESMAADPASRLPLAEVKAPLSDGSRKGER